MGDISTVFLVLGVTVALFLWNRIPVEIVAIGATLTLVAAGILTLNQGLAGFGDATVVFIAALFVVSEGIDSTGVTTWAGQQLIARSGGSKTRMIVLTMAMVAVLTAVISVNGAVSALLPMVVVIALRIGMGPSKLLMPLAFGAHAGSLLALTGTPIHILVSDAAVDAGEAGFQYFEFALVGIPVVIVATLIVVLFGDRLLPDRRAKSIPPNLSDHARTLINEYSLGDWVARLEVAQRSPLVGRVSSSFDLSDYPGIRLVGIQGDEGIIDENSPISAGDIVVVRGEAEVLYRFTNENGLVRKPGNTGGRLIDQNFGVVEVVVPPRSGLLGTTVFPGMVTEGDDYVILAVQRRGEYRDSEQTVLEVGDILLIQGAWDSLDEVEGDQRLLVVDSPAMIRRQAVPLGPGARPALVILAAMVVLLATGVVAPVTAALLAAIAMVLSRVLTVTQAYRAISWTTVILVGAMIPVSVAVQSSGAADLIAGELVRIVGDAGPYALLIGLFVVTAVFGQLISNTATALIMIPIAITAATDLGVSVRPVMMSLTIAAAAAFLTPVATPANLMIQGPGAYEFTDYWKLGLPMLLLFMAASVFLVPVFWPF